MSMYNAIKEFSKQFLFEPEIKNGENLLKHKWYIVAGMGGSHLAADILKALNPGLSLIVHKNYGLPNVPEEILENSLFVASSYSGNTEETIDAYEQAKKQNIPLAVVSVGGELLKMAKIDGIPYVEIPDTKIQPRCALGFVIKAVLALMKEKELLIDFSKLSDSLSPQEIENKGKDLADALYGYAPIIYSSQANESVAYNWKIKFNETGKIPAFYNVFPELNHNEMTSFDAKESTLKLSQKMRFILLRDNDDDPRIQKRMDVLERLFKERNLTVAKIKLDGLDRAHKIFSSLLLADWAAYYTAVLYNVESEQVPMVEEFKKLIK